jgi:hypothetical protein
MPFRIGSKGELEARDEGHARGTLPLVGASLGPWPQGWDYLTRRPRARERTNPPSRGTKT